MKRLISLLAVLAMVICLVPVVSVSAEDSSAKVVYTFIGDEAAKAGFAQGLITITPGENSARNGYYLVYFTNGTNILSGYDELASAKITGEAVRIEVKDGMMIPEGAKGIAVFESTAKFLDNPPAISTAVAKCAIPASKQITLSTPELVFGLASDVHVNYEGVNPSRGAFKKWENALKFFKQNNATYIMVSGDMTGDRSDSNSMGADYTLEKQYKKYMELVTDAGYSKDTVFECLGNHGNIQADLALYNTYTAGSNEVHPYTGSPYYYVMLNGKNGAKNTLIISLWQELDPNNVGGYLAGNSAKLDNFSKAQMDWFENLLKTYGNDANTNIFVLEHSAIRNYGAGEKYNGVYSGLLTFKTEYTQNMRFKALLETYKDITVFSGHTHETLYDGLNYSDMGGTFANTVHVSSTCWPRAYYDDGVSSADGRDGRKTCDSEYGSEAYIVKVYKDYVVYTGYNLSTNKIIPAGCLIIPTKSATPTPDEAFEGSGTASDPYLIQNESDFLVFTNGMNAATSESAKYGDGKYFKQTADINMIGIESYLGTHANGNAKVYFGGNYDGNGYEIKVSIKGPEQRSVFPYIYGTICNLVIRGDIISDNSVQPIRTNRGKIINCIFDCYLQAENANGLVYSNYSYVYNVYATGYTQATNSYPIAMNDSTGYTAKNVYYYYSNSTGTIEDNIGTQSKDYTQIANVFNKRTGSDYTTAAGYISPAVMSKAGVSSLGLALGHNGELPEPESIPKTGNIAKYGTYTLSPLFRMGGADVDWGWDATKDIAYPDENGATLVDGKLATAKKYSDAAWIGFHTKTPAYAETGYHHITFNYTSAVDVTKVNLYVATTMDGGVSAPKLVQVYVSDNGSNWTKVSEVVPTGVPTDANTATEKLELKVNRSTKYIQIRFTSNSWALVSEAEIIAGELVHVCAPNGDTWKTDKTNHWHLCDCGEKVDIAKHEGTWKTVKEAEIGVDGKKEKRCTICNYLIAEETIPALEEGHKCAIDGKGWYTDKNNHWHECDCGTKMDSASHKAGEWKIVKEAEIGVDGKKEKRCTVCNYLIAEETIPALEDSGTKPTPVGLRGDVNKNGEIDSRDYVQLKRAYFKTAKLDEVATRLADVNNNGELDSRDYVTLKRVYFKTAKIAENIKYVY